MKIKDLPSDSRPRERLIKKGPKALSDAELLDLGIKERMLLKLLINYLKAIT